MKFNNQNESSNFNKLENDDLSNKLRNAAENKDSDSAKIFGALENIQFKRLRLVFDLQRLSYQVNIIE